MFLKGRGSYCFVPGTVVTKLPKFVTQYSTRIDVKTLISVSGLFRENVLSVDINLQENKARVEGGRRASALRAAPAALKAVGYTSRSV